MPERLWHVFWQDKVYGDCVSPALSEKVVLNFKTEALEGRTALETCRKADCYFCHVAMGYKKHQRAWEHVLLRIRLE
jgi:hypothetical protein